MPAVPVLPVPPLLLVVGQRQLHQRRLLRADGAPDDIRGDRGGRDVVFNEN